MPDIVFSDCILCSEHLRASALARFNGALLGRLSTVCAFPLRRQAEYVVEEAYASYPEKHSVWASRRQLREMLPAKRISKALAVGHPVNEFAVSLFNGGRIPRAPNCLPVPRIPELLKSPCSSG